MVGDAAAPGSDFDVAVDPETGREELESAAQADVCGGDCRGDPLLVGRENGGKDAAGHHARAGDPSGVQTSAGTEEAEGRAESAEHRDNLSFAPPATLGQRER